MDDEPILILGTGALAGLFAARLSGTGKNIVMLGTWDESIKSIRANGVRLVERDGRESSYPVMATNDLSEVGHVHHALVLTKSWQTARVSTQLSQCLSPDGMALTLQNGMGNWEILAGLLGPSRVALGTTTTPANILSPGRVAAAGQGTVSVESNPRLHTLVAILRQAGFQVRPCPNMEALLWGKLVVSSAINPLTAILRVSNGALLELQSTRQLISQIAKETATVAKALGISLPFSDPTREVETVIRKTATNRSSMLQDMERGAPTEIDAICGAIVRSAENTAVPTPLNHSLWHLVRAQTTRVMVAS